MRDRIGKFHCVITLESPGGPLHQSDEPKHQSKVDDDENDNNDDEGEKDDDEDDDDDDDSKNDKVNISTSTIAD